MIVKAQWVTTDSYGNKLVTDEASQVVYIVAPTDKKTGKPFPSWEEIAPGRDVEGNPWQSKTNGKWYLFAPEAGKVYNPRSSTPGQKQALMKEAIGLKQEGIRESQENKQEAIKISSTFRDATLLTIAQLGDSYDNGEFKVVWLSWREWLLDNYEVDTNNRPPFPNHD